MQKNTSTRSINRDVVFEDRTRSRQGVYFFFPFDKNECRPASGTLNFFVDSTLDIVARPSATS